MSKEPYVSVIMGAYNCKSFESLNKSIDSIITQTFSDFELIICDDGSTNNTFDELKKIQKKDSRIKLIHYDNNVSLGYALNYCLKEANGKYIARQDDDDISKPTRLQEEIDFLEKNPQYCMVGCNAEVFDDNGKWGHYRVPEKPTKYDFLKNSPFMHPTLVFRKEALELVNGYRISKETRRCEDYDMFMRMYAIGLRGYNLQNNLYEYYIIRNDQKKHRPMKYRIDEAKVRFTGFKNLKILSRGILYVAKPIIAGLIPGSIFSKIQNRQYI